MAITSLRSALCSCLLSQHLPDITTLAEKELASSTALPKKNHVGRCTTHAEKYDERRVEPELTRSQFICQSVFVGRHSLKWVAFWYKKNFFLCCSSIVRVFRRFPVTIDYCDRCWIFWGKKCFFGWKFYNLPEWFLSAEKPCRIMVSIYIVMPSSCTKKIVVKKVFLRFLSGVMHVSEALCKRLFLELPPQNQIWQIDSQ